MKFKNCKFKISKGKSLLIGDLLLPDAGCVTFIGSNGSGKTSLAKALAGELEILNGDFEPFEKTVFRISFEKQQKLIDDDYNLRSSDILSEKEQLGITPRSLIYSASKVPENVIRSLCERLKISDLLDKPYSILSSGEGRKVLVAQAILSESNFLIMDAPFDGLDVQTRKDLMDIFFNLYQSNKLIALIVNRFDEIPGFSDWLGIISDCELLKFGSKQEISSKLEFKQLENSEILNGLALPKVPSDVKVEISSESPVDMKDVVVRYQDKVIINNLSMTIKKGENWQFVGPNGAGKSTLISLITGDHPQGYCNKLKLFGVQRGSGETIWDIKKNIGFVSPSLHLSYRVNCNVLSVILSGFYDSIGLYDRPGDEKIFIAHEWLKIIGLDTLHNKPFQSLSFGQQRLILIARSLVKHPPLLILDEPLQGLDSMSRLLVKKFVEYLIKSGETQVIFVSHHKEDAPNGISHVLEFIPCDGSYSYSIEEISYDN